MLHKRQRTLPLICRQRQCHCVRAGLLHVEKTLHPMKETQVLGFFQYLPCSGMTYSRAPVPVIITKTEVKKIPQGLLYHSQGLWEISGRAHSSSLRPL
jgi:hypothetical protein